MDDDLIAHHLDRLYQNMLEANLLKIVQPFSCVEIAHVAELIKLPVSLVRTIVKIRLIHRLKEHYLI